MADVAVRTTPPPGAVAPARLRLLGELVVGIEALIAAARAGDSAACRLTRHFKPLDILQAVIYIFGISRSLEFYNGNGKGLLVRPIAGCQAS